MESKNRRDHVLGRSIVLERQERFSIETSERIYFKDGRLYSNPPVDVARTSSSSDDIEKIHRTRERVENLNNQINHEIERLKEVNDSLTNKKDERFMTWAERFRANPPLTRVLVPNREHKPRRESCAYPDDFSKPAFKEIKQKDVSPSKPPPKALPLRGVSPKGQKSTPMRLPPKELPTKELTLRKPPPKVLPAKELPPKAVRSKELPSRKPPSRALQGKELLPRFLPAKELPPRFIPTKELPPKRLAAGRVSSKDLASRKPPASVLPSKELPPKRLPPKELASRKPLPRALPAKELPPKSRELASRKPQPRFLPVKELAPKAKRVPPKELASRNPPPRLLPAKELPVPVKEAKKEPKAIPPKDLPPKRSSQKDYPPKEPPPRRSLPKSSTQKEPKPEKHPPKEVATKKPMPKEEPIEIEFSSGDSTPEEQPARACGGCCYCYDPSCYPGGQGGFISTNVCCNIAFDQGVQYGIPYCTARRRVTDLNTQEICGNRCVGISPKRNSPSQQGTSKVSVSPSPVRKSSKDKRKSPLRGRRPTVIPYKKRDQKSPKVEIQEKKPKPEKQPKIEIPEKIIIKEKPPKVPIPEENKYQPPKNIKKEKPKISFPKTEVTKLDVSSPETSCDTDKIFNVDERMCRDYLSLYYQENSKEVLSEGPKMTPTYTRLPEKNVKSEAQRASTKERQRDSISQECEKMKPSMWDQNNDECLGDEDSIIELYPNSFSYESCFKGVYQDRSSLRQGTESDSTSYASHPVKPQAKTAAQRRVEIPTKYPSPMAKIPIKKYKDERPNLSSGTGSSQSPTTDSRQQNNLTSEAGSSRYAQNLTTDSRQQKHLTSEAGSSRYAQNPTTDSRQQKHLTSEAGSSRYAQNPTTDSRQQKHLTSEAGSSRYAQNPTTDSRQQRNLGSAASPSRYDLSQTINSRQQSSLSEAESSRTTNLFDNTYSSSETIRGSPKYPSKKCSCKNSSYDGSDEERFEINLLEAHRKKTCGNTTGNQAFKDTFSVRSEKTSQERYSGKESSKKSYGNPMSNDFKSSEMSDEEDTQETVRRAHNDTPRVQFQPRGQNLDRNRNYSSRTDDIQSRCECDGYETARSNDSNNYRQLASSRSYSTSKSSGERPLETVCEKRTRTVTFKDEKGELNKPRQVEEQCRSKIDWEQALKYRRHDPSFPNDNYTARSSSSAEHTCLESCSDEEAYDSCIETLSWTCEQKPPLKACPCMYRTYRQLAALCQTKNPHYR